MLTLLVPATQKSASLVKLPDDRLGKKMPYDAPAGWGMGMFYYRISKWVDSPDSWIMNRHLTHVYRSPYWRLFWWDVSHVSFIALSSNLFIHYTCAYCLLYTVIKKYMAQSLHVGLYWPFTNLPFGIGKPSILTLRYTFLKTCRHFQATFNDTPKLPLSPPQIKKFLHINC